MPGDYLLSTVILYSMIDPFSGELVENTDHYEWTITLPEPAFNVPAPNPEPAQPPSGQPPTAPTSARYRGSLSVSCVSDGRVRFEGTVTHNGQPVNGVSIGFKSRLVEGTTPVVRPEISGPSDRRPNWPNGYFESIVDGDASTAKDKHLEIWVLNSAGERISDYVNWDTDGSTGTCNTATVNFVSP